MERDDLRVKTRETRVRMSGAYEVEGHRPVTDADLAELGYVKLDGIDVGALQEAVVRHHLLHRNDLADYLPPESPIFVVAVQVLAALEGEDTDG